MNIYLDESGDLGWIFTAPYRFGGSSRYLTIACLAVTSNKKHLPKRLIRKLYNKFKWPINVEKKWANMTLKERIWFAKQASVLHEKYSDDVRYISITVKKQNVQRHIRTNANNLYNYMIGCLLINEMAKHSVITFTPDQRSIRVESGNSLHDYLQTQLWFEKRAKTILTTQSCDSAASLNVQFADMLSGVVQGHFEDGNVKPWTELHKYITVKTLFF